MRADVPGPPAWGDEELAGFFEEMLPDLFVEKWSPDDWDTFLDFAATGPWRFDFMINGEPANLFRKFRWVDGVSPLLTFRVGRLEIDCHFFGDEDFELTLDPYKVKSEADYNELIKFMSALAKCLNRRVLLCAENNREHPLFAVE